MSGTTYTTCSATGANTVKVTNLKGTAAGYAIQFRVLATLDATTGATSVISTAKTEYQDT